jgi:flavin reductase (DIM6/NTAB) family NADH-FMN oxidoreductase RutF
MFATGVTIVTARAADGGLVGLTANSFNSVSLEPPLVLWSLARRAGSMPVFTRGSHYAINILAADQKDLAQRFATRDIDRFAGVAWREAPAARRCWTAPSPPSNAPTAAATRRATTSSSSARWSAARLAPARSR